MERKNNEYCIDHRSGRKGGIGFETARQLGRMGNQVTLPAGSRNGQTRP